MKKTIVKLAVALLTIANKGNDYINEELSNEDECISYALDCLSSVVK